MKKVFLGFGVLLAIVVIFYLRLSSGKGGGLFGLEGGEPPEVYVEKVARTTLVAGVAAPGEIIASRKVDVHSSVQATVTALRVSQGQLIASGAILLELAAPELVSDLRRAELSLDRVRAELSEAQTKLDGARRKFETTKTLGEKEKNSRKELDEAVLREGLTRDKYETAKREYDRIAHSGALVGDEVDRSRRAMTEAEGEWKLAQDRLRWARNDYDERIPQEVRAEIDTLLGDIRATEAGVERALKTVAEQEEAHRRSAEKVEMLQVRSPMDGTVTMLNVVPGEMITPGAMNSPGTVLVTIADLGSLMVEAEVDETDVVQIRLGLRAHVTLDAFPGARILGKVTAVASSGRKSSTGNVSVFPTRIGLEPAGDSVSLRPGLTAHVEIETSEAANVLGVPIQAVVQRARTGDERAHPVCFTVLGGKAHEVPVTTGLSDDTRVAILSGLSEEQNVIVGPSRVLRTLREGDPVRPTQR